MWLISLEFFLKTTWLLLLCSLWQTRRAGQPMPDTVADIVESRAGFNGEGINSQQAMADYVSAFNRLEELV